MGTHELLLRSAISELMPRVHRKRATCGHDEGERRGHAWREERGKRQEGDSTHQRLVRLRRGYIGGSRPPRATGLLMLWLVVGLLLWVPGCARRRTGWGARPLGCVVLGEGRLRPK